MRAAWPGLHSSAIKSMFAASERHSLRITSLVRHSLHLLPSDSVCAVASEHG